MGFVSGYSGAAASDSHGLPFVSLLHTVVQIKEIKTTNQKSTCLSRETIGIARIAAVDESVIIILPYTWP